MSVARFAVAALAMLLWWGAAAGQGAHPFGVPESGAGGSGWLAGFFGQVSVWQSHFYRQLTGAVRAWQDDGGAAWVLAGLSFAYGVFHALGPGHGKAVISSYVLANRQTARNGALLALLSALIQALTAIALVAVLAVVFNATAAEMNEATRRLELASYVLVTALGARLVWIKAIRPLRASARGHAGDDEHHEHHGHAQDCGCGHAHVPDPEHVAGPLDWRRAGSAILAVGLRPCSGALIVLVFALSQGFFLAGVASALAMGLGTGLTVAVLACLAVAAGGAAERLGRGLSGAGAGAARLRYGVEVLAACAVLLLGVMLLGGVVAGGG